MRLFQLLNLRRYVRKIALARRISPVSSTDKYDWARSVAFCPPVGGPYAGIYLLGKKNASTELKLKLIELLESSRQFKRHGKLVDKVYDADQIYHGSAKTEGPDLILQPNMATSASGRSAVTLVKRVKPTKGYLLGIHDENGIFVAAGPGVVQGASVPEANIMDIFPTILYQLGLPIPQYLDGDIIQDIFLSAPNLNREDYIDIDMRNLRKGTGSLATADRSKVEQRLKDLGYLE